LSQKPEPRRVFSGLWRVVVTAVDAEGAAAAADAFGELGAVSAFEEKAGGVWRVEGLTTETSDHGRGTIAARLALAWLALAGDPPEPRWERVPPTDWLRVNQASFQPLEIGSFYIHGSHHQGKIPAGRISLLIDAATAFGTGEHATTRGCLLALDAMARVRRIGPRILDMGTGTGVLAMAAARTSRRRVVARDIDPESVRVAAHNVGRNGVAGFVAVARSAGYRDRLLQRAAPYDLVMANILARPLVLMARDLGRALAHSGIAILSGLLPSQESLVLRAHGLQRLRLKQRIVIDGWSTLVLARGRVKNFRSLKRRSSS
jgi:ribosomal protein L11 methyltransferase